MAKSRPGQPHHAPNPDTLAGRQYAALQSQREAIAAERRENNETLQAIKEAERAAKDACGLLAARLEEVATEMAEWSALELRTRDRMREVMGEVIAAEIKQVETATLAARQSITNQVKEITGRVNAAEKKTLEHQAKILGYVTPGDFIDDIAKRVMNLIRAEMDEQEDTPAKGLLLTITERKGKEASKAPG